MEKPHNEDTIDTILNSHSEISCISLWISVGIKRPLTENASNRLIGYDR